LISSTVQQLSSTLLLMTRVLPAALVAGAALSGDAIRRVTRSSVHASTSFGDVVGSQDTAGRCDRFLGIPFAKPPVGDLRFANTQPWENAYPAGGWDAQSPRSHCVSWNDPLAGSSGDEDCLFLNVYRPQGVSAGDKLPVMVWIHGGAFMMGASTEEIYDGCSLVSNQNVIMASMNYRMNIFGFGTFEEENGEVDSNWGLEDQREALRWLRQELGAFGGDSEKITIFGQSAGGISVYAHMASPMSAGLFRGAISISGLPAAKETAPALQTTRDMGTRLECTGDLRACLRGKSAQEIMGADDKHSILFPNLRLFQRWEPVQGAKDLLDHPNKVLAEGNALNVPFIHGYNTNEGSLFTYLLYLIRMSDSFYTNLVMDQWMTNPGNPSANMDEEEAGRVLATYPPVGGFRADNRWNLAEMAGDSLFVCASRYGARFHSGTQPTWGYRFNYRSQCTPEDSTPGIFHGLGLELLFNNTGECTPEEDAQQLITRKQTYFANFAKRLDPNSESSSTWPRFDASAEQDLVLQAVDEIETHYKEQTCTMWEETFYSKTV